MARWFSSQSAHIIQGLNDLLKQKYQTQVTTTEVKSQIVIDKNETHASLQVSCTCRSRCQGGQRRREKLYLKFHPNNYVDWHTVCDLGLGNRFTKEIYFYKTVLPELIRFQREEALRQFTAESSIAEVFPAVVATRYALDPFRSVSGKADSDGVIVFDNLKSLGYAELDFTKPLNEAMLKACLKTLARYHAIPLAYKNRDPLKFLHLFERAWQPVNTESCYRIAIETEMMFLKNHLTACVPLQPYINRIHDAMEDSYRRFREGSGDSPWVGTCHGKFFPYNIMSKQVGDTSPVCKIFDMQHQAKRHVLADVACFLALCAEKDLLKDKYDSIIYYYHAELIDSLVRFAGVNMDVYSLNNFKQQLKDCFKMELIKCLQMLPFLCCIQQGKEVVRCLASWPMHDQMKVMKRLDQQEYCRRVYDMFMNLFDAKLLD